jgi:hypothetical protein
MEDIPPGVTAVLTQSSTDILSHVAIRARSQGVLLATCYDDAEWAALTALQVCGCVDGHVCERAWVHGCVCVYAGSCSVLCLQRAGSRACSCMLRAHRGSMWGLR